MSEVNIIVGDDLAFSANLVSPIWIELDGEAFPGEGWTDFSHTLLCQWTEALLSYRKNSSAKIRFGFMDGPYEIVLSSSGGETLTLDCMREDKCLLTGRCDVRKLAEVLCRALRQMGYLLHKHGFEQGDTKWMEKDLQACAARLRELL